MHQLLVKLEPQHPLWPKAKEVLRKCAQERSTLIEQKLRMTMSEGKQMMQKIFNGGKIPAGYAENQFCVDLQKTSIVCRWIAASAIPEAYSRLLSCKDRPDVSALTYLWNVVEDKIFGCVVGQNYAAVSRASISALRWCSSGQEDLGS